MSALANFRSIRPRADVPHVTYYLKVALWELRRRRLTRKLERRGAAAFEVILALREDAKTHPHPVG